MNKKLIKQLEGVGFKESGESVRLVTSKCNAMVYWFNLNEFVIYTLKGANVRITSPTFPQILAAIKEYTGVDLQPKKTKRQEIEELKKLVKLQNEAIEKIETRSNELAQQVKANKKAIHEDTRFSIDSLKDGFEDYRTRIEELEGKEELSDTGEFGFVIATPHHWSGARIRVVQKTKAGYLVEKVHYSDDSVKHLYFDQLELDSSTPKEAPKEADKQPFEVGDRVCIKIHAINRNETLKGAVLCSDVFFIKSEQQGKFVVEFEGNRFAFLANELEHAPKKELKFGEYAEIVKNTRDHHFEIGERVLIGNKDEHGFVCLTEESSWWCNEEDLKAL